MPSVLRVSGPHEQLRQAVVAAPFDFLEAVASRREREGGLIEEWGTFNFTVSDADGDEVPDQIRESERFLYQYFDELQAIHELAGVQQLTLDFNWDFPTRSFGQCNSFPNSLLKKCALLGIDIQVSVYPHDAAKDE